MTQKYLMENYLQVLEESLRKKKIVLSKIEEVNIRQEHILKADVVSEEDFDATIEEKGTLIDALTELDKGFESLYENIKVQLAGGREMYSEQIRLLQNLIREVTEQSISIQTQEARNKVLAEKFFLTRKQEMQKGRKSSKAALDYYRNMNQSQVVSPQFMDKKK